MKTMKTMQIIAPGKSVIKEAEVPDITSLQLLMEVEAVTTCPRWDMYMMAGKDVLDASRTPEYPLLPGWPGHEVAGRVVATGNRITRFRVGDRIMAHAAKMYIPGETGYAQFMRFTEDEIEPIPDGVSFKEAAPFELLKCVMKGLGQFPYLHGRTIAVTGLGPAGLLAVQAAKILGAAHVIGVDIDKRRREWAKQHTSAQIEVPERLEALTFDYGFDCTGFAQAVQNLVDHARSKVVVFGVLHGHVEITDIHWHRSFSLECFDASPVTRQELDMALHVLSHADMNMHAIITHDGKLEDYATAVQLLESKEAIKVCFYPSKEFV